jgi:hypothetical protein
MSNACILAEHADATAPVLRFGPAMSSGPSLIAPEKYALQLSGELAFLWVDEEAFYRPMITALESLYTIRDWKAIQRFVVEFPNVFPVLLEASTALAKHFGPDCQVTLEIVSDPETENQRELVAYVQTSLPVADALVCLDSFDRAWFLERLDGISGLFNVNLGAV